MGSQIGSQLLNLEENMDLSRIYLAVSKNPLEGKSLLDFVSQNLKLNKYC